MPAYITLYRYRRLSTTTAAGWLAVDIKIKKFKNNMLKKTPGKAHKIKIKTVTAPQLL